MYNNWKDRRLGLSIGLSETTFETALQNTPHPGSDEGGGPSVPAAGSLLLHRFGSALGSSAVGVLALGTVVWHLQTGSQHQNCRPQRPPCLACSLLSAVHTRDHDPVPRSGLTQHTGNSHDCSISRNTHFRLLFVVLWFGPNSISTSCNLQTIKYEPPPVILLPGFLNLGATTGTSLSGDVFGRLPGPAPALCTGLRSVAGSVCLSVF